MVKKIGDVWRVECTQCGWVGTADTKEAAREKLRSHLDVHRTPEPVSKTEDTEKLSTPPQGWENLDKPGEDPFN